MNPRSRRAALYAIATVAILASINALAHSYVGLYGWATTHGMTGWQATTWPAEVDVFLVIGELALYIAYLDLWPIRHKTWPWTTAIVGLAISVAGNVGHVRPVPDGSDIAARLTAATSPLAAFAGLAIALLVLKLTRSASRRSPAESIRAVPTAGLLLLAAHLKHDKRPALAPSLSSPGGGLRLATASDDARQPHRADRPAHPSSGYPAETSEHTDASYDQLLTDAREIVQDATNSGARLSQRLLAQELRHRGHRVANGNLKNIRAAIGTARVPKPLP